MPRRKGPAAKRLKVWFSFQGGEPQGVDWPDLVTLNAFIAGVEFACAELGVDDYTQLDSEEEARAFVEEGGATE